MSREKSEPFGDSGAPDLCRDVSDTGLAAQTVQNGHTILRHVATGSLMPACYQPRRSLEEQALATLACSVAEHGIIQPIIVRRIDWPGESRYGIIAGERRWRAAQMAGLQSVPVVIHDVTDRSATLIALIENVQRQDLNVIEEALALSHLQHEFGMTQQEIGRVVGRSRVAVTHLLRLLSLHAEVKGMLERREIDAGHGKVLAALPASGQLTVARTVVLKGLSVRQTEKWVQRLQKPGQQTLGAGSRADPDIHRLEEMISQKVGASVVIDHGPTGKGKLIVSYGSLEELDGVLAHIR